MCFFCRKKFSYVYSVRFSVYSKNLVVNCKIRKCLSILSQRAIFSNLDFYLSRTIEHRFWCTQLTCGPVIAHPNRNFHFLSWACLLTDWLYGWFVGDSWRNNPGSWYSWRNWTEDSFWNSIASEAAPVRPWHPETQWHGERRPHC